MPCGLYPLCFVPYERKERSREAGPRLRGTKGLRLQTHSLSCGGSRGGRAVSRQGDNLLRQCSQPNRHDSLRRLTSRCGAHVQSQLQKKVARADRVEGSIVLFRSAARSQRKGERSPRRPEPWWNVVFGAPLFLRTLLRLVFVCLHRHRGPPITLRVQIPSNLPGCRSVFGRETYITCLDCGQKFAYNYKTRRLVDFWGVHDAEALARVRRRVDEFFSPLRGLAAKISRLNMKILMSQPVKSVHRLRF
jgi:hypothetical protein